MDAEMAQFEANQQFEDDLVALEEQDLDDEVFEVEAVDLAQEFFLGWSDGLRASAEQADDPELSQAFQRFADGLADAAPQLNYESLETGEIPGMEDFQEIGATLSELCQVPEGEQPPPTP